MLTPTRELAVQNEESFRTYGKYLDVRSLAVYGGVRIDRQLTKLHSGVDIVIATPGRLLDHIQRHDKVWICRRRDIAAHWRAAHPYRAP